MWSYWEQELPSGSWDDCSRELRNKSWAWRCRLSVYHYWQGLDICVRSVRLFAIKSHFSLIQVHGLCQLFPDWHLFTSSVFCKLFQLNKYIHSRGDFHSSCPPHGPKPTDKVIFLTLSTWKYRGNTTLVLLLLGVDNFAFSVADVSVLGSFKQLVNICAVTENTMWRQEFSILLVFLVLTGTANGKYYLSLFNLFLGSLGLPLCTFAPDLVVPGPLWDLTTWNWPVTFSPEDHIHNWMSNCYSFDLRISNQPHTSTVTILLLIIIYLLNWTWWVINVIIINYYYTFLVMKAHLSTVAQKPEETCKQGHLLCEPETPG